MASWQRVEGRAPVGRKHCEFDRCTCLRDLHGCIWHPWQGFIRFSRLSVLLACGDSRRTLLFLLQLELRPKTVIGLLRGTQHTLASVYRSRYQ